MYGLVWFGGHLSDKPYLIQYNMVHVSLGVALTTNLYLSQDSNKIMLLQYHTRLPPQLVQFVELIPPWSPDRVDLNCIIKMSLSITCTVRGCGYWYEAVGFKSDNLPPQVLFIAFF